MPRAETYRPMRLEERHASSPRSFAARSFARLPYRSISGTAVEHASAMTYMHDRVFCFTHSID